MYLHICASNCDALQQCLLPYFFVTVSIYGSCTIILHLFLSVSLIDCRDPRLTSGAVGEYNTTTVSSVIVYQCQQPEFTPSVLISVCGEDGRWSPDPSQVMCRMMTSLPTGTPTETIPNNTTLPTGKMR